MYWKKADNKSVQTRELVALQCVCVTWKTSKSLWEGYLYAAMIFFFLMWNKVITFSFPDSFVQTPVSTLYSKAAIIGS